MRINAPGEGLFTLTFQHSVLPSHLTLPLDVPMIFHGEGNSCHVLTQMQEANVLLK
jgi:hypothetical protein